jgi:hypothetical protein
MIKTINKNNKAIIEVMGWVNLTLLEVEKLQFNNIITKVNQSISSKQEYGECSFQLQHHNVSCIHP